MAAVMLAFTLAGCSDLLDVDLPGDIPSDNIANPALAVTLGNSVQNSFECFYTNYVGGTAVFTDEMITGSQRAGRERWDERSTDGTGEGECRQETWAVAGPGYQALGFGRDITTQVQTWTDAQVANRAELLAKVAVYTGYTITLMAEGFCYGVVVEDLGPRLGPAAAFQEAESYFTIAIGAVPASSPYHQLALLGRARAQLGRGALAGARSDAGNVSAGFEFNATYGTVLNRENVMVTENHRDRQFSVHPKLRGLTVQIGGAAAPDPRIPVSDAGLVGIDGQTPIWTNDKSGPAVDDDLRVGSWNEAQLIIAETWVGTTNANAVAAINAARATYGIDAWTPTDINDDVEIMNQVLTERQRELSFEGKRMGDLRRHKGYAFGGNDGSYDFTGYPRQWDSGVSHLGTPFFEAYCLPFPQSEIDVNPNIDGNIRPTDGDAL